jgi:hypothetical protein
MTIAFNLNPESYIQSTFSCRAIFAYCLLFDFWMLHVHVLTFVLTYSKARQDKLLCKQFRNKEC